MPFIALLLGGCEQEIRVDATQQGGVVAFTAKRIASSGPICITDVRVMAVGSGGPRTVWHVTAPTEITCVDKVTYPKLPAGFAQDATGTPFTKGQIYSVTVKVAPDLSGAQLFVPGAHDGDIGSGG